jgi:transposase-like protein
MLEESRESYQQLFETLKETGLKLPSLVQSDAPAGWLRQYGKAFQRVPGQRCKVHFMRNILAQCTHKGKQASRQA